MENGKIYIEKYSNRGESILNKIIVNDERIELNHYEEVHAENGELKGLTFSFKVQGKNLFSEMKALFKETNKIVIPKTKTEFLAKVKSSSFQYQGNNNEITDATLVDMEYTLSVIDEDEEDESNLNDWSSKATAHTIISRLNASALIELLIEKEIITEEEFDEKLELVTERDSKRLVKEITGYDSEE